MKIELKKRVALLAIAAVCAGTALAQQTSTPASQKLRVISFHGDMAALLGQLAQSYGVTIGMEADARKPRSEVTVELHDATLPDILNAIVESEPRYRWRDNSGFIEVFPVSGTNPLLDLTINFQVRDVKQDDMLDQLMNLPEVQAGMAALNLKRRVSDRPSSRTREEKFSLSLEQVSLRQALDRIAKESGAMFWLFRQDDEGSLSVSTAHW